ncbi:hypothetical protein SAMN05880592_1369 [Bosea sp. TND4EK4]|nr:hypothetical protein SAMN05880592_1369 [Bosea sp. TND4EK4]
MLLRRIRALSCLVIALAMALGMTLSAAHVSAGHNAYAIAEAEAVRHAELAAEIAAHGHAHEDGEADERLPGHVHGHNTADHVHETANVVALIQLGIPSFARTAIRHEHQRSASGQPASLERPPRSVVA